MAKRSYTAARPDKLVGAENFSSMPPHVSIARDIRGLVNHSRYAFQNIDLLRSWAMMVRRHVVGKRGIVLQMQVENAPGKPDDMANDLIERAWEKWGRRGHCTVCKKLSWWNVENICATLIARDGGVLIRIWRGTKYKPFGIRLQVLPVDQLDLRLNQRLPGGRYIESGVEHDKFGAVIAYHLRDCIDGGVNPGGAGRRVRVPARDIVHGYRVDDAGQVLGAPGSHAVLRRAAMLSQYEESAVNNARFGAAAMAFVEHPESPVDPFALAPTGGEADESGQGGEADEGGRHYDDSEGDEGGYSIPRHITPGAFGELPPGAKLSSFTPSNPDSDMPGFIKSMSRGISSGLGVSYAGLTSDMEGANFSSLRDGRGEERDEWRIFQRDLFETIHTQVFEHFLEAALLSRDLILPVEKYDKFNAASWRPRGWPSVNPKDDAQSNERDMANGLRSPSDIVAERGENLEDVIARTARDLDAYRAAGVPIPAAYRYTRPPDQSIDDDQDDQNQ